MFDLRREGLEKGFLRAFFETCRDQRSSSVEIGIADQIEIHRYELNRPYLEHVIVHLCPVTVSCSAIWQARIEFRELDERHGDHWLLCMGGTFILFGSILVL